MSTELIKAMREVLRISERQHVAWDAAKAGLAKLEALVAATDAQLDALMPVRLNSMLCTKCGYQNVETTAPAGPTGAPCENSNCQYTAFVRERDYTAEQVRASMRAAISAATNAAA